MKNFIALADYCSDSLTVQELRSALYGHLSANPTGFVSFVHSSPSTIHTAFLLHQLLTTEQRLGDPNNLVVFVNTDPRLQAVKGVEKAQGSQLVVARMRSGAWVYGPNAGFCFSLVQKDIQYLYVYQNQDKGTQFRSRDLYMRVGALLMEEKQDDMELEELKIQDIPALDKYYVGHIDNYGNIKTTIPRSYLKGKYDVGDTISVTIAGVQHKAYFADNIFGKEPDVLVVAPGSSGPIDDPYLEVVVWQHMPLQSARKFYPDAKPGDEIVLA
ncbi:MAG: hypothetical protein WC775_05570 [Patescibacteria group bacterium]|jgi:hypothetical protein